MAKMTKNTKQKIKLYRDDLLRAAKAARNLTVRDLYRKTKIAPGTQRRMFKGENVEILTLRAFADFLNVDWVLLNDLDGNLPGNNLQGV